jgi:hypothetical protein
LWVNAHEKPHEESLADDIASSIRTFLSACRDPLGTGHGEELSFAKNLAVHGMSDWRSRPLAVS